MYNSLCFESNINKYIPIGKTNDCTRNNFSFFNIAESICILIMQFIWHKFFYIILIQILFSNYFYIQNGRI